MAVSALVSSKKVHVNISCIQNLPMEQTHKRKHESFFVLSPLNKKWAFVRSLS